MQRTCSTKINLNDVGIGPDTGPDKMVINIVAMKKTKYTNGKSVASKTIAATGFDNCIARPPRLTRRELANSLSLKKSHRLFIVFHDFASIRGIRNIDRATPALRRRSVGGLRHKRQFQIHAP